MGLKQIVWRRPVAVAVLMLALGAASPAWAESAAPAKPKTFVEATKDLDHQEGLLPVYLDAKGARVLVALSPDGKGGYGEYLYQVYMRSGLGSTKVGLSSKRRCRSTRAPTTRRSAPVSWPWRPRDG